nr:hypothetical protein [Tanacetum cinerariifolium]
CLVDLNPTTAKDAWTYITGIFQDNKRPRAMALKAKLSNLKLRDLCIDGWEPFPDLKTVRSLLTTHEMRLKSRVQNPLVDATSTFPMVLLAKSNASAWRGPSLDKVNNPCWSFAKGSCRFVMLVRGLLSIAGVQTLSGPLKGVHLVLGPSQPPVQFMTEVQQQQRGAFPGSVRLG